MKKSDQGQGFRTDEEAEKGPGSGAAYEVEDTEAELEELKEETIKTERVREKKEKEPKRPKQSPVGSEMADWSLARLMGKQERLTLSRTIGIVGDEEKLKQKLDSLEKAKESLSFVKGGSSDSEGLMEVFEDTIEDFGEIDENGNFRAKKLNFENVKEVMADSWEATRGEFFLFRPFLFLKNMFVNGTKWRMVKKYESEINLYNKGKEIGGKTKEKITDFAHQAKKVKRTMAENPAARESLRILNLRRRYKRQMHDLLERKAQRKISPKKFAESIKTLTGKITNEGLENGKMDFLKQVKQRKFPGLTIKTTGKLVAIEILSRGILEGIQQGRFGAFTETISDSSTWLEAIPLYGTWQSFKRLDADIDEPAWTKWLDLGVNVVSDGILIGGVVTSLFTGGTSLAGATIAKTATKTALKRFLTRRGLKQMVKSTAKGTLRIGKEATLSAGKWSAISFAAQKSFEKLFPDGVIERIAVKALSPQQQRLVSMVK